jgi:uncharacterized protein YraI
MFRVSKFHKTAAVLLIAVMLISACAVTRASAADATSAAGQVSASVGGLFVRSQPSTSGTVLTQLPGGSYVTLMYKTGSWWYVAGANPAIVSNAVYLLNIRGGPGTSYAITGTLPAGRIVFVLSESNDWYKILANGTAVGYASAKYLKSIALWPVPATHKISQYFSSTHEGIDIGSSVHGVAGDNIAAALGGKVVYAGTLNGYGYVVYIDSWYNGKPIQTRYAHLNSAPLVQTGSYVGTGQLIGYMGDTGESTGAHLHFEVRIRNSSSDCIANADSVPVNPLNYVS